MKILWLNSTTDDSFSHTELIEIPPLLQKKGAEIRVVVASSGTRSELPDYYVILPMLFGKLMGYRLLVTVLLPVLCAKYRPDIILTDWMSATLVRLVVLLRYLGFVDCKFVHDVRTVPVKHDGGKGQRVYRAALTYARRHFDGITTITPPLRELICRDYHFTPDRVGVWTSGVDTNRFKPQEATELRRKLGLGDKFVVFYHGSVNENRGVIELARASKYLQDNDNIKMLIVGGGNEWKQLRTIVNDEILDRVILESSVPYADVPGWIAAADLCAVPLPDHHWWRVSSPLKLMEYLAMGKPVLLTDIVAHRSVLPDDGEAYYVAEAVPEAFAEGIRKAYSQRDRLAEMSQSGRRRAETDLTWEKQAEILHTYLGEVVKDSLTLRGNAS
jgi:glycosyltransferase involved in cell wall biosynthesis